MEQSSLIAIVSELQRGCCPLLERLMIDTSVMDIKAATIIAQTISNGHFAHLRELEWSSVDKSVDRHGPFLLVIREIMQHGCPQLRSLNLEHQPVNGEVCQVLGLGLRSGACRRLEIFKMPRGDFGDEALVELIEGLRIGCPLLRELDIAKTDMGQFSSAALILALHPSSWPHLEVLSVGFLGRAVGSQPPCMICEDRSTHELVEAIISCRYLTELHLASLCLSLAVPRALPAWPRLKRLVATRDRYPVVVGWVPALAKALIKAPARSLEQLIFGSVVTDEGLRQLTQAIVDGAAPQLQSLTIQIDAESQDVLRGCLDTMKGALATKDVDVRLESPYVR